MRNLKEVNMSNLSQKLNYEYSFSIIKNSMDFFNSISDIATLMFTLYDDVPSHFYFFKDKDYDVKLSNDKSLLKTFNERLPELYDRFINSLHGKTIGEFINTLFIEKIISFERQLINRQVFSKSNFYQVSYMKFKNTCLYYNIFKLGLNIKSNTPFSKINQKINLFKDIVKKHPNPESINLAIKIIKSLNGRQGAFYFEDKYHFSWAFFIIFNGNTSWLNILKEHISTSSYDESIDPLLLAIVEDDVNILNFYFDVKNAKDFIVNNPYFEIKKIQPDYINNKLCDEANISLLSLSIILDSFNCFKYLVGKVDIDIKTGLYEQSAIFYACSELRTNFIDVLIENNCDLKLENKNANIASELLPLTSEGDAIFKRLENKRKAS